MSLSRVESVSASTVGAGAGSAALSERGDNNNDSASEAASEIDQNEDTTQQYDDSRGYRHSSADGGDFASTSRSLGGGGGATSGGAANGASNYQQALSAAASSNNNNSTFHMARSTRKPPQGYINFSPRKLKLPPTHHPWGHQYEHPTLLSPSGVPLELAPGSWAAGTFVGHVTSATDTSFKSVYAQLKNMHQLKQSVPRDNPYLQETPSSAAAAAATTTSADEKTAPEGNTTKRKKKRGGDAEQVSSLTSKLVNTVAPPSAPYTAFAEASRYHDIIHPPVSPRSLLLSKLAQPSDKAPATRRDGLPVAPDTWHITSKLKPRAGGLTETFDTSLKERDSRLYQGGVNEHGGVLQAPGSSPEARRNAKAAKVAAAAQLAEQQALALQMGLLPGNAQVSAWSSLSLTPRPKTTNDSRGRKEVLHMLDAFRATPRGPAVLAQKERATEVGREARALEKWERETGERVDWEKQQLMRKLTSAPSGQQRLQLSPRSFSRAQQIQQQQAGGAAPAVDPFSQTARSASAFGGQVIHSSPFSTSIRSSFHTPAPPGSGRSTSHTGTGRVDTMAPGFFPAGVAASYPSAFHAHLGSTARSSTSGPGANATSGLPSTSSFHRVIPPSFMNAPLRVETLSLDYAHKQRARIAIGARDVETKFAFDGALVKDKKVKLKSPKMPDEEEAAVRAEAAAAGSATSRAYSRAFNRASGNGLPQASGSQSARGHYSRPGTSEEKQSNNGSETARSTSRAQAPDLPLPGELDISLAQAAIRDYEVRASACNRAGRKSAEANAYFCMGVLWDNCREYLRAIDCYKRFKEILCEPKGKLESTSGQAMPAALVPPTAANGGGLRTAEDTFAEALAHNCMGVSFQNLGPEYYSAALYHHARHRDIADLPGQFIAFTNMGLIYQLMASNVGSPQDPSHEETHSAATIESKKRVYTEQAAHHHQQALRCAIQMSSLAGQNIAIGNLGLTGLQHHDLQTARACMERHLQLSQSLDDYRGQSSAFQTLGTIASQEGAFEEAMVYFQQAAQVAHVLRDPGTADQAKVAVGVAKANAQMDLAMRRMAEMMTAQPTSNLQ